MPNLYLIFNEDFRLSENVNSTVKLNSTVKSKLHFVRLELCIFKNKCTIIILQTMFGIKNYMANRRLEVFEKD
jgi:hypothetical protein